MSILDVIHARSSYRGRFADEPVPREHLRLIMEAGLAAPSGCNKQTTSLIAVDDSELLACMTAVIDPPLWEFVPALICVLTKRVFAYRDKSFSTQDYAAAIENMLLAAVDLGYQSCWIEGHITDDDQIGRLLADMMDVPEDYEMVCILPIGKALEKVRKPRKLPFEERAWFNGFRKNEE